MSEVAPILRSVLTRALAMAETRCIVTLFHVKQFNCLPPRLPQALPDPETGRAGASYLGRAV